MLAGKPAAFVEELHGIMPATQHQCRRFDLGEKLGHVDVVGGLPDTYRILGDLPIVCRLPYRQCAHEMLGTFNRWQRVLPRRPPCLSGPT
jgi:hypothetical protein